MFYYTSDDLRAIGCLPRGLGVFTKRAAHQIQELIFSSHQTYSFKIFEPHVMIEFLLLVNFFPGLRTEDRVLSES